MERRSYILCGIYPDRAFLLVHCFLGVLPSEYVFFTSEGAVPLLFYMCLAFLICDTGEDVEVGEDGGGVGLVGHN